MPDSGTRPHTMVGARAEVSCYHHHAIATLGRGLVITVHSKDGVIEAAERPVGSGWCFGVQWHPEDLWATSAQHLSTFETFVEAART